MVEDRLRKDYDVVENLSDLIEAREERESAFADDVDAMEDIELDSIPFDPQQELTYPHRHEPPATEEELLGVPGEEELEFDWQDSVEEMLPTDPEPGEDMIEPEELEDLAEVDVIDLLEEEIPTVETSPDLETSYAEEEEPAPTVELEDAMETDSDELDFVIGEKFKGEVDHRTAHREFEEMRTLTEDEENE